MSQFFAYERNMRDARNRLAELNARIAELEKNVFGFNDDQEVIKMLAEHRYCVRMKAGLERRLGVDDGS